MAASPDEVRELIANRKTVKENGRRLLVTYEKLAKRVKSRGVAADDRALSAMKADVAAMSAKESPAADRVVRRFVAADKAVESLENYDELHGQARRAAKKVSLPKGKKSTGEAWKAIAKAYSTAGASASARFETVLAAATSATAAAASPAVPAAHPWGDFGVQRAGVSQKELEAKLATGTFLPPIGDLLQSKTDRQLFHEGKKTRQQ